MGLIRYLATDKYAIYIWGSYGVTFLLLGAEVLMLLKRKRNLTRRQSPKVESRDARFETSLQEMQ
jgi:heme exporter protein CcmD